MSVKKYRSVDEMGGPQTFAPLDPDNFRRLFQVIELAAYLHPHRIAPGVRKFRSTDDPGRQRAPRPPESPG